MKERIVMDGREEGEYDLGPCCACGKEGRSVRNLIELHKKARVPGTGWGCFVCGLPADGAVAVICDECLEAKREIRFAIDGYALSRGRAPVESLNGEFDHDQARHVVDDLLITLGNANA